MEKIVILAGGKSSEREVSAASGMRVARAFCDLGIKTALIDPIDTVDLTRDHFYTDFEQLKNDTPTDKKATSIQKTGFSPLITDSVLSLCKSADAVFIALHGGEGENGRIQSLFEYLGIKYFGSGPEGSANAMNKLTAKRIFEYALIPTPLYTVYKKGQQGPPIPPRYPCVVKPASEGSSVGITLVKTPCELGEAVNTALKTDETVLLEAEIRGREITVGILDDTPLAVTEIIPKSRFYDYGSKYTPGGASEITPAPLPRSQTERALRLAKRVHKALGLSNFSRVDMMIESGSGLIYVLEANTVPGMTATSLLPLAAEYRGIDFTELCARMAGIDVKRR